MTVIAGVTIPATSSPAEARTRVATLRVGSFNIVSVSTDPNASGNHRKWRFRRPVIASHILSRRLDVVGLQEANQSSIYRRSLRYGINQFMDLRGALAAKGGRYAVTNRYAYNCLRSTSKANCRYRNRGAAQDNRILYNTRTVTKLRQGSVRFYRQSAGKNPRYLAWAVFRHKRTGKQFFFATTHLDPYSTSVRKAQWRQTIRSINRLKRSRQVVVVGDFNTSKFDRHARTYLPAMKRNGYGDVLNQTYRRPFVRSPRARWKKHGWVSSYNGFRRSVRSYGYVSSKRKVGNGIDWIFASNRIRVRQWEVVSNINMRTYRVRGVMPSDHSLVRATLALR